MPARFTLIVITTSLIALASCSDLTQPTGDTIDPPLAGKTAVHLTDAPFPYDKLSRVDLYIVRIAVSLTADTGGIGGDTTGSNFTTVAEPNRRFNILELQNGVTAELGEAALPPGRYQAVRMVLDTDSSSITLRDGRVLTGSSSPGIAWLSSAGRPQLNALVYDAMTLGESGGTIVIDFDVGQSFFPVQTLDSLSADEGFIFSPWMRAVSLAQTGSVSGAVVGADTAASPPIAHATVSMLMGHPGEPENTWSVMATGSTDAAGNFTMAYLSPNRVFAPRTYIFRVEAPPSSPYGKLLMRDVLVAVGQERVLGTLTVPRK